MVDLSHGLIADNRDLVLRALDGDTTALGDLLAKAYLAGEVAGVKYAAEVAS